MILLFSFYTGLPSTAPTRTFTNISETYYYSNIKSASPSPSRATTPLPTVPSPSKSSSSPPAGNLFMTFFLMSISSRYLFLFNQAYLVQEHGSWVPMGKAVIPLAHRSSLALAAPRIAPVYSPGKL